MRKPVHLALATMVWLLASPSLQFADSEWVEVGVPPTLAKEAKEAKKAHVLRPQAKKPVRRIVRSSAPIPPSVAPGLYPMRQIEAPEGPRTTGSAAIAPPVPGYPQVPTVIVTQARETSQDRVMRCTHQGALGGLPASEQGAYIHTCAFQ